VLDDLFYYPGPLGVVFKDQAQGDWNSSANTISINVWAPTAQNVSLQIFNHEADATPASVVPMTEQNGVWTADGEKDWKGKYYLFSVQVWVPSDDAVDTNITTDPYSIDIALNGTKSRITDLRSEETKPPGWDGDISPALRSFSDMSIYELHIRGFSVNDLTVPATDRGTYEAFADENTNG
jgi:pullulanase